MHLNRASVVYGIMILLSAGGLWAVISIGDRVTAPRDLAGKWALESRFPSEGSNASAMTIEQSGRFFQISFEKGPRLNMELQEEGPKAMALAGGAWHLGFKAQDDADEATIVLTGPQPSQSGAWNARRTVRKYPLDISQYGAGGH